MLSVQLNEFSQTEHTHVTNSQIQQIKTLPLFQVLLNIPTALLDADISSL